MKVFCDNHQCKHLGKRKSGIKFWKHGDSYRCMYKGGIGFRVSDVYSDTDIPPKGLMNCVCYEEAHNEQN